MIVLDASVMIAILDGADAHFPAAQRIFLGHTAERLVAHRMTVGETLVQPARAGRTSAAVAALAMLGVGYLDEPDDPVKLAELRASSGLRLPDCVILHAVLRDKAKLATFDVRLANVASGLGVPIVGTEQ
jgi:predicted nucleic acid-binding protein